MTSPGSGAAPTMQHRRDGNLSIEDYTANQSKFRFKSSRRKHHRHARSRSLDNELEDGHRGSRRHRHHPLHHHRSKRHRGEESGSKRRSAVADASDRGEDRLSDEYIDPDVAFRESLFDAMADDEGAQFWEGVYGQPVHNFPNVKVTSTGELEHMTDEEYVAFVRAKMYEKTHQHLVEERARREEAKKERARRTAEGVKEAREAERFQRKVDESLQRGQERKNKKAWASRWEIYNERWRNLAQNGKSQNPTVSLIPWPVESGEQSDVDTKAIQRFFLYAPSSGEASQCQLLHVLKQERIRWHPDKIQQRLGGQSVDEKVIHGVTEVFQIIDRIWAELRRECR